MESSSEDGSFVWTDASNSTSSEDMTTKAGGSNSGGEESEYDKSYKKKLHKELFTYENGHESDVRSKKRKRERYTSDSEHSLETSRKKIKVEPESGLDVTRVEGKHMVLNGYDERLLDEKVNREQEFLLASDKVKKKKKKKSTCNENIDVCVKLDTELTETEDKLLIDSNTEDLLDEKVKREQEFQLPSDKVKKKKKKKSTYEDIDVHVKLDSELTETEEKPSVDSKTEESTSTLVSEASDHRDITKKKKKKKKSQKREESPHGVKIEEQTGISNVSRAQDTIRNNKHIRDETRDCNLTVDSTTADIDISEISKISNVNVTQDDTSTIENNRRRLSERLLDVELVPLRKPSSKLKLFTERNKTLKACAVRELTEFTVGEGDEVWLVTCPSEVDVTAFRGRSLELEGRCKVKLGGAGYEGGAEPAGSEPRAALMVSAGLRRVTLAGRLALHRRLPRAPDLAALTAPPPAAAAASIPLPDTKLRHPLLGAHYKKALKLPPAVSERLHAGLPPAKHKRRRKSEAPPSPISALAPPALSSSSKKKAKRKKHDLEAPETWESERAIEESLFDF